MATRITKTDLDNMAQRINEATGSPLEYGNVGHYCFDYAYGGAELVRLTTKGGGCSHVGSGGHVAKREAYERAYMFLCGVKTGKGE